MATAAARSGHMIVPPRLVRGQTIGIAAPSGPVKLDRLRHGLACLGDAFELHIGASVTAMRTPRTPSYLAASDDIRIAELNAMLADPDIRAIILARGGYGLMRILPQLDPALLQRDPKPIVGFSDATALLGWAYHAGVRAIHGPLVVQLADLPTGDVAQLIALLTEPAAPGERPWSLRSHGGGVHRGPAGRCEPVARVAAGRHAVGATARRRRRAVRRGGRAAVRARSLSHAARADRRACEHRRGRPG